MISPNRRVDAPIAIHHDYEAQSEDFKIKPASYHVALNLFSSNDIKKLTPSWQRLVRSGKYAEPFYQPYWFKAFATSFGNTSESLLLSVHKGEELVGTLPLTVRNAVFGTIPAQTLRSMSGIHSCRYDFMVDVAHQDETAHHAWSALANNASWDAIEVFNVPEDGAFYKIMEYAEQDKYLTAQWSTLHSPYLKLPKSGPNPFNNCPSKYKEYRKRLRGYRRKLEKQGALRFIQTTDFSESVVSEFLALESSGWKGRSGGAIACDPIAVEFYRSALRSAGHAGHIRITSMLLDNRTVAMDLGLLTDKRFYCSPKVAYDEEFSRYSPGHVLNQHVITELVDDGVECYDFLGPRAHHKYIWTDAIRKHNNCYIFRPTVRGKACHAFITKIAYQLRGLKYKLFGDPQYPRNKR